MTNSPEQTPTRAEIYNVTRLNREVRAVLEGSFPLVWVEGEISNLAQPASGHIYFTLKDEYSQVRCAMFRNRNQRLKFAPDNGMLVMVRANVSLYENRGEFQLIIEHMEPAGAGALQRAFEELKQHLHKEGLFDEKLKKPVPHMARHIGIITSPTGAAIRDILNILNRRYPAAEVIIYPTAVQGDKATDEIIRMLKIADQRDECDVLILARGGGSLEDLWCFNNEKLARAIFDCKLPIVTGIGHEIDYTIADFVSDYRAPTPSAAAELVSPDQRQLRSEIEQYRKKLGQRIQQFIREQQKHILYLEQCIPHPSRTIQMISQRLDHSIMQLQNALARSLDKRAKLVAELKFRLASYNPVHQLKMNLAHCDELKKRLSRSWKQIFEQQQLALSSLSRALNTVSPLSTLKRGYSIVNRIEDGAIIRTAGDVKAGDRINTRFSSGHIHSKVEKIYKDD